MHDLPGKRKQTGCPAEGGERMGRWEHEGSGRSNWEQDGAGE